MALIYQRSSETSADSGVEVDTKQEEENSQIVLFDSLKSGIKGSLKPHVCKKITPAGVEKQVIFKYLIYTSVINILYSLCYT